MGGRGASISKNEWGAIQKKPEQPPETPMLCKSILALGKGRGDSSLRSFSG